jgi:hypothetical protein
MSTSAIRLIQEALVTVLVADTTLMDLVDDVVNDVVDGQAYPYVQVSHAHEKPWHTFGGRTTGIGWQVIVRLHIYSRYEGDDQALRILERMVTVLNFATLTVTGYTSVCCEYLTGRVLVQDVDKIETRHIPAEFKVTVHQ